MNYQKGKGRDLMRKRGSESKGGDEIAAALVQTVSSPPKSRPSKTSLRAQAEDAIKSGVPVKVLRPQTRRDSRPR